MKKNILLSGLVALLAIFSGCEMNEEPKSEASVDMVFSSENGLKTYAYSFYNVLPSRGSAFRRDATADYGVKNSLGGMEVGAYTTNSATSWSWSALRNINFFLENNVNESLSTTIRDNYNGIARLFRARFYFDKLVQYGEVPWIDKVFNEAEDPDLYNPRDTRDVIIGHILEDLDYAYTNILEEDVTHNSTIVNKWTAAAFKSRVCLFEAAWRKYHAADQLDIARTGCTEYSAKDLYKLAAEAAKEVMDNGPYKLYTSGAYSDGRGAYRELFIADKAVTTEVMMAIETDKVLGLGEQNWWYNSSTYGPHLCMSRKFMLSYLNADGTPYVEKKADGSYKNFVEETTGRDTRLNQTIRGADYTRKNASGVYEPTAANFTGHTLTGYQFTKFAMDDVAYDDAATNDNDIPIMRYAEVLLTYAEARVQNNGWDEKVQHALNDLRDRCGMPNVPNSLSKDAALELVRNERRIELAAEGHRYDDIRRYGLEYCREAMNGESTAPCGGFDPVKKEWQKYVVIDKVWGDRLLLMPIPTSAMDVNPLLKDDQNPGY